jgi:hypothetical protein
MVCIVMVYLWYTSPASKYKGTSGAVDDRRSVGDWMGVVASRYWARTRLRVHSTVQYRTGREGKVPVPGHDVHRVSCPNPGSQSLRSTPSKLKVRSPQSAVRSSQFVPTGCGAQSDHHEAACMLHLVWPPPTRARRRQTTRVRFVGLNFPAVNEYCAHCHRIIER